MGGNYAIDFVFALGGENEVTICYIRALKLAFKVCHIGGRAIVNYVTMLKFAQDREGEAASVYDACLSLFTFFTCGYFL